MLVDFCISECLSRILLTLAHDIFSYFKQLFSVQSFLCRASVQLEFKFVVQ
jgi:hypothetical protein